ncbi:hypothetical protein FQA39_LY09839 [Lamprigera yunnana]|nr:hypothetical protein FQA39_LY09839 [Lamprigera yunnana]
MYAEIVAILFFVNTIYSSKLPLEVFQHPPDLHLHHDPHNSDPHKKKMTELNNFRIFYQLGNSESHLPVCSTWAVCNRIDLYETPWLERKCRCPNDRPCPSNVTANDGYTLLDRHRQYKLCEPIKKLPKCRYFRDVTWTYISRPDNITEQIVHCHCPKNSVTYLIKPLAHHLSNDRIEYRITVHPDYNSRFRDYDVSVFELSSTLEFNSKVQPLKLTTTPQNSDHLRVATVREWRRLSSEGSVPSLLQTGDSGGPLVNIDTKKQVGVVLWGYGYADPNFPGVYSNIYLLKEWRDECI